MRPGCSLRRQLKAGLCAESTSEAGPRVEAITFREGAAAALADLRNALKKDGPSGALDRAIAKWGDDLARHKARGSAAAWISYAQGGLASLDEPRSEMAEKER